MFIQLKHKSLDVYQAIRNLVNEIYKISLRLPNEEKLTWFNKYAGRLYL